MIEEIVFAMDGKFFDSIYKAGLVVRRGKDRNFETEMILLIDKVEFKITGGY